MTKRGEAKKYLYTLLSLAPKRRVRRKRCLIWPYSRQSKGYARIKGYSTQLVSRLVCEARHGKHPKGKPLACHNCDSGHLGCVEPTHLEWGSALDNSRDKLRAGTSLKGIEQGPLSREHRQKLSFAAKQRIYGTLSPDHRRKISESLRQKNDVDVIRIKELRRRGWSSYRIATELRHSRNTVMKYW